MTAPGSPYTLFRSAIEREDLVAAELDARARGSVTLVEELELTALVALKDPRRCSRYAARWLARWRAETPAATREDAAMVATCLGALGGHRHAAAVGALRELVSSGPRPAPVARGRRNRARTILGARSLRQRAVNPR